MALLAAAFLIVAAPPNARAQAPPAGPVALEVSPTPRTTAMGQAWVAGRDADVIFYNPAQIIGARPALDVSITRHGTKGSVTTLGSSYAAGKWSFTLGWGVVIADFSTGRDARPLDPDVLLDSGSSPGSSRLAAVGGAITVKGWRLGATGKYAADLWRGPVDEAADVNGRRTAWLVDVGGARSLFSGTIAFSVQDLASDEAPVKWRAGWSIARAAGPLDLTVVSQVSHRDEWTAGAAGLEAAYSWIEGYAVALRGGIRRPETAREHPLAWGAAFTADRFTVEYARQTFDGHASNGVTLRWR